MQNEKTYRVFLDGEEIGTTKLEAGDIPMGIVLGRLLSNNDRYFWINYCAEKNIDLEIDELVEIIQTVEIPGLKVYNAKGIEIKGRSVDIAGCIDKLFVAVNGIPYSFYEEEFPEHVARYNAL